MAHCVEKLPHSCGSSDGLQVFENDGKFDGYCFSCGEVVPHPYGIGVAKRILPKKVKTQEEIEQELQEIDSLSSRALETRKLTREALEHFGIKVGVSLQDGVTPFSVYFPTRIAGKRVGYKARLLEPKKFWGIGELKDIEMFGWQEAISSGSPKLFITEGEFDAVALYQALKDRAKGTDYETREPAVVSLTSGASGIEKDITSHLKEIETFKEVILCLDQDEPGKKAAEAALQFLPLARLISLPYGIKDANEMVMKGRSKLLAETVLFRAEKPKNTRIVRAASLYQAAREPAQWGLSWPWEGLTNLTRGIRTGETYYLGAGVKMGKSELVNTIACHLMLEHKMKVFLAKPEEANNKTVKMVLGKAVGKIFHDPKIPFDGKAYDKAAQLVGDKLYLLSLYQHLGWESLRSDILVAASEGCKGIFIDPITNLYNGQAAGEAHSLLQEVAQDLSALAKDKDFAAFIFCHLKAPDGGPPHERGGKVYSSQFAGSRAMMRSCNYMLGLEGDKDPEKPIEERNMRHLQLLEDREFGEVGTIHLYWDYKTGQFNEVKES